MSGEIYWYKHIPKGLSKLFPKMLSSKSNKELVLEKIQGISLSYLYSMGCLTLEHLKMVMLDLEQIHTKPIPKGEYNIYANWADKLTTRIEEYIYNCDDLSDDNLYWEVRDKLEDYAKQDLGIRSIIHGDPVLSNILLDSSDNLKFIDMRGKLKDNLTIDGDKFYDYAKVHQSLLGYDYILHDKEFD